LSEASWHDLGPTEGFEDEQLREHLVAGVRLCVGRSGDRWFAIDDTCPHAGGSLAAGMLDEDLVICPVHAYAFEAASGRCIDEPACSVSSYPTRLEGGILQVRL
jgi:nitrite reductase/ring-hydroxylating ferredoxin subunit